MAKSKKIPFTNLYPKFEQIKAIASAKNATTTSGNNWGQAIETVFTLCCDTPDELFPNNIQANSLEDYIQRWVNKYFSGFNNRASQRVSNAPSTVPDPLVDIIISARLPALNSKDIDVIKTAHRLSMSAENVLGLLLEEYLAEKLLPYGWYCCWGETIRSVDFCTSRGELLQIKNRSNSENSSSSAIRKDTTIKKWHRINANTGACYWENLKTRIEQPNLPVSENDFSDFVRKTITNNTEALYIASNSLSWNNKYFQQLSLPFS